jgi:hypothetical protein
MAEAVFICEQLADFEVSLRAGLKNCAMSARSSTEAAGASLRGGIGHPDCSQ